MTPVEKIGEAEASLRQILADPPYGDDGLPRWEQPRWRRCHQLLDTLPAGVSPELVAQVFDTIQASIDWLLAFPASFDDAIVRCLDVRARHDPDAAFVVIAWRAGREPSHERLRQLMALTRELPGSSRYVAPWLTAMIGTNPEIVEAAQAAVAVGATFWAGINYVPILALDGSAGSLDVLLPHLEAARMHGKDLAEIRANLISLFPDTPATAAWIAAIEQADDARLNVEQQQLAEAQARRRGDVMTWIASLAIVAPPTITLTVTFRNAAGAAVYSFDVDSRSFGFRGRRNGKARWSTVTPAELPSRFGDATAYTLRVGAGLDRAKLDAWVRGLLRQA